jgi:hypothetical protein
MSTSTNQSWLFRTIERVRNLIDDPGDKYDDNYILRECVSAAVSDIFSYLNQSDDTQVIIRHPISLVVDQEYYQLPRVHKFLRVAQFNADGTLKDDWYPENEFSYQGPGWRIEANTLAFRPFPRRAEDWDVWYVPSAEAFFHYATDGRLDDTLTVLSLSTSPTLGDLDRFDGAYVGQMARLVPLDGVVEERLIVAHDADANTVTVRRPFTFASGALDDDSSSTGNMEALIYEIAPVWATQSMAWAVAAQSAMYLAPGLGISQARLNGMILAYRRSIKTLGDGVSHREGRKGKRFARGTIDNADREGPAFGVTR